MRDNEGVISSLLIGRIHILSLIYICAVAEYLNFRHAASALGVSQSSVSTRVKSLEQDIGIQLFERHARGVRLTEPGRQFIERVAVGIDHLDHAVKTAGMVERGERGRLRLGIHALIPGSFLATLIERYRKTYPGIDVEIAESTARECIMRLRENSLDMTFVVGSPELPDCHSRPIWREKLLVALPAHHRLSEANAVNWTDLANETFIVRQGSTGPQVYDHITMRLALTTGFWIERFDVERVTLLTMVAQGYGITICGESLRQLHTPSVKFLPIHDEPEPLSFSAIWSPHNRSSALRSLLSLASRMSRAGWPD